MIDLEKNNHKINNNPNYNRFLHLKSDLILENEIKKMSNRDIFKLDESAWASEAEQAENRERLKRYSDKYSLAKKIDIF